jgi:tetratricopeptide (TPR) repeat protein
MAGMALAGACLAMPASAQGLAAQGLAAQSAKITELGNAGKYSEAIPLAQAMLANLERGPASRNLAGALNNLAQLYGDVGRDTDAEPMLKRSIAILEKIVGLDSVAMAPELTNLGALYERQGRYAEAEPLFKRALLLCQKSRGPNHPDVGRSLNNLATLYERQDRQPIPSRCSSRRSRSTRRRQARIIPRSRRF